MLNYPKNVVSNRASLLLYYCLLTTKLNSNKNKNVVDKLILYPN